MDNFIVGFGLVCSEKQRGRSGRVMRRVCVCVFVQRVCNLLGLVGGKFYLERERVEREITLVVRKFVYWV